VGTRGAPSRVGGGESGVRLGTGETWAGWPTLSIAGARGCQPIDPRVRGLAPVQECARPHDTGDCGIFLKKVKKLNSKKKFGFENFRKRGTSRPSNGREVPNLFLDPSRGTLRE
jgi:hypothetical protein